MSDAPERIWLQWGGPYGENTWSEDQIDIGDVEYIRADSISDLESEVLRLREEIAELKGTHDDQR